MDGLRLYVKKRKGGDDMKNELMYMRWQRNIYVLLLIGAIIFCLIGWHRYKEERRVKEGLEQLLGNMYEPLGGL